jgi:hypothetical protein
MGLKGATLSGKADDARTATSPPSREGEGFLAVLNGRTTFGTTN